MAQYIDDINEEACMQKTAVWSEEDELILNEFIESLRYCNGNGYNKQIDWLKSLKERIYQTTWRPSDEQLDIITRLINSHTLDAYTLGILQHFYQDLKKLTE